MIKKMITVHITTILLVGGIWGLIMYLYMPEWWFPVYPVIPATFLLVGLLEILMMKKSKTQNAKMLNSMLMQRIVRWGIVLVILVVLIGVAHPPKASFIISFMGMFITYSFLSIWFLLVDCKEQKKIKEKES